MAYSHNQESFRFMMDPMLADGSERISAMGYGNAINALSDQEGGLAKYFSQRFAQVTNPPLDSIREADGMSMRVALGAKPDGSGAGSGQDGTRQIVIDSPILDHLEMVKLREQQVTPLQRFDLLYTPVPDAPDENAAAMVAAMDLPLRPDRDLRPGAGRHRRADGPFHLHHPGPAAAAAGSGRGQPAADRRPGCGSGSR